MPFEIGERVIFRSLHWEVADNSSEHLLELFGRSRENQGRKIKVIAGLEPIERAQPPVLKWTLGEPGWSHPEWKALHDAYRLTLSHGRGHLGAADWGRLVLEPYQLVPLQRIESLPYPRLMLADDTGLGKTAEAGLILFRLMQRRRADRVLILTRAEPEPARWQQEMRDKFGIAFEVINNGQDYARLRRLVPSHLSVFASLPRLVMSMHFASQSHVVDNLRKDVRWDVVIADEAHHLAESGSGDKRLAELGEVVAERSEALLLLTATPHNGKGESFASLIRLLDKYAVVDPDRLDPAIVRPLVVRRLKPQVIKADGSRFLRRQIHTLDVEPFRSKSEKHLERGLRDYTRLLRRRAAELEAAGERSQAMGATFLETFLRKRLASSAHACRLSLHNRLQRVSGLSPTSTNGDETPLEDRDQRALETETLTLPDGRTEAQVLADLIERAEAVPFGAEAKVKAVLELLSKNLAGQKVIIFTEFLDTLEMLAKVLDTNGYAGAYESYHGETRPKDRETIRQRFLHDPSLRILLGTDAASEGINLQKSCRALIHIEIPWNPNRYEQRNGRIDRYGQTERPQVYLLIAARSLEDRVAQVVLEKLEKIAEDVGSVSNVFPLARRVRIDQFLEDQDADTAAARAASLLDEEQDKVQAELKDQVPDELVRGDLFEAREMEQINQAMDAARAFTPEYHDIQDFLEFYLRLEHGRMEAAGEGIYRVFVPQALRAELGTEAYPRATFRRDIALQEQPGPGQEVEFLSPGHPLVQAALRRMRGKLYAAGFNSRLSYRKTPTAEAPGFFFTFAVRFTDGRGETIEERFEPVFVTLSGSVPGQVSQDAAADLQSFARPAPARNPNLTPEETQRALPHYKAAFSEAEKLARAEITRRQQERARELAAQQEQMAEEALLRLGRWQQASETRLRQRFSGLEGVQQYDLFGLVSRRLSIFRKEQELLLKQEQQRRADIRAMKTIHTDSADLIGALVIVPEEAA